MSEHSQFYDAYMQSALWQVKRLERMTIDEHKCVMCGRPEHKTRGGLHVHHLTYCRLGFEDVYSDLVTLCSPCHKKIHKYLARKRRP